MRKLRSVSLAAAFATSIALAGTASAEDDKVVVGFASSTSGFMLAYSGPSANAALIAIEDINARGGVPVDRYPLTPERVRQPFLEGRGKETK